MTSKEEKEKKDNIYLLLSCFGSIASLTALVVSATWFAGAMDKRISMLEKEFSILNRFVIEANVAQDRAQNRFQESTDSRLGRMQAQVEKFSDRFCRR